MNLLAMDRKNFTFSVAFSSTTITFLPVFLKNVLVAPIAFNR